MVQVLYAPDGETSGCIGVPTTDKLAVKEGFYEFELTFYAVKMQTVFRQQFLDGKSGINSWWKIFSGYGYCQGARGAADSQLLTCPFIQGRSRSSSYLSVIADLENSFLYYYICLCLSNLMQHNNCQCCFQCRMSELSTSELAMSELFPTNLG